MVKVFSLPLLMALSSTVLDTEALISLLNDRGREGGREGGREECMITNIHSQLRNHRKCYVILSIAPPPPPPPNHPASHPDELTRG